MFSGGLVWTFIRVQALVARRESDMLVCEGGGGGGGGGGSGGDGGDDGGDGSGGGARYNVHFLVYTMIGSGEATATAVEYSRPRPPPDHHGRLWPCSRHFRARAPSPFR